MTQASGVLPLGTALPPSTAVPAQVLDNLTVAEDGSKDSLRPGVELLLRIVKKETETDGFEGLEPLQGHKRRRISQNEEKSPHKSDNECLIEVAYSLLGSQVASDLDGLHNLANDCFSKLNEDDQVRALDVLGLLSCSGAGTLQLRRYEDDSIEDAICSICDATSRDVYKKADGAISVQQQHKELSVILNKLIRTEAYQHSKKARIAGMLAARRSIVHGSPLVNLETSDFGKNCLICHRSSVRELRIAAGRTLQAFVTPLIDLSARKKNILVAMEILHSLSNTNDLSLQETTIMSWAQLGRVVPDDSLEQVLVRLVQYLGHPNQFVYGVAYEEIVRLAQFKGVVPRILFMSFWRNLSIPVVTEMTTRPQIAGKLCELAGMTIPSFLNETKAFTVPYLVLFKRTETLQTIAKASGKQTVFNLCTDKNYIGCIIAILLVQDSSDPEAYMSSTVRDVIPEFTDDPLDALRSEPMAVVAEILRLAVDDPQPDKNRYYKVLQLVIQLNNGVGANIKDLRKRFAAFFDSTVLGIMTIYADVINDLRLQQSVVEKQRCLKAIAYMVSLARDAISNALPQASLESDDLRDYAFSAWTTMIKSLSYDLESQLETSFSIVLLYWNKLSEQSQREAHDMIEDILNRHGDFVEKMILRIPSLKSILQLKDLDDQIIELRNSLSSKTIHTDYFQAKTLGLIERLQHENITVVEQAISDLVSFLIDAQNWVHESVMSEKPDPVIGQLTRQILEVCLKVSDTQSKIYIHSAQCLGLIGCLDTTRVENTRQSSEILVASNFRTAEDSIEFVMHFLKDILVNAFLSATNTKSQSFLAWVIQECLKFCGIDSRVISLSRLEDSAEPAYRNWISLPESLRPILTPFVTSKYFVSGASAAPVLEHPIFPRHASDGLWLRTFVLDLIPKAIGENAQSFFKLAQRIIKYSDQTVAAFLLPYLVVNIVVDGTNEDRKSITEEIFAVLSYNVPDSTSTEAEHLRFASDRRRRENLSRIFREDNEELRTRDIHRIEQVLNSLPADVISARAVECKSYARALFYWEQYTRNNWEEIERDDVQHREYVFERMQDIYSQIDEPDGIEGISSHMQTIKLDNQILQERKSGRWEAVKGWYELLLDERPNDLDLQVNLLTCLKESKHHDDVLKQTEAFRVQNGTLNPRLLSLAVEASWAAGKWDALRNYVSQYDDVGSADFKIRIGDALIKLHDGDNKGFKVALDNMLEKVAKSVTVGSSASIQASRETLLQSHVITDLRIIAGDLPSPADTTDMSEVLTRRLNVLGAFPSDKQDLLDIRRAAMLLRPSSFSSQDVASTWLTTARLARKAGNIPQSLDAVMHASRMGEDSAIIEHARILWMDGQHRKAIKSLEGAISASIFRGGSQHDSNVSFTPKKQEQQTIVRARAYLLLAKWLDSAGHTQSQKIVEKYHEAQKSHNRWEKGHYYLGRHYNKLFESQNALPPEKKNQTFMTGEIAKLVITNYLRSLAFGTKYIYQTLPRLLTLWMDLGEEAEKAIDPQYATAEDFRASIFRLRTGVLTQIHAFLKKYIDRLPAFIFYTSFAQIVARITHPNESVFQLLKDIIVKVVGTHPQQALWALLAVVKSSNRQRSVRGAGCLKSVKEEKRYQKKEGLDIRTVLLQGQKLSDQLLQVCDAEIPGKPTTVSISNDLRFNHKSAPSLMAIPAETTLTASLPTIPDNIRGHKAFPADTVTIHKFLDEVLVLNSLQRPRKITIIGSDGKLYSFLCKPKDDLRKDQRLMDFNSMINRALKKDAESSQRRLYIKTYAVTPLNEECGIIEWVDGLKTFRDIVLKHYKAKRIAINYSEIRTLLEDACSSPDKLHVFTDTLLPKFPPVLHEWFVEAFAEPEIWFNARLRYTRSCAVMSMVGMVLGLGDRHGENILLEEGNGGIFHVDFNCLFDKGLTFEKPERVPFRLTHNMVNAFGVYGYEGPFRRSCELTLKILRQHEVTLMTILETFLHDPTTDFIGRRKRTNHLVPNTPQQVLDSVQSKVRGIMRGESISLSVEGQAEELIKQATSAEHLAHMYIGWCSYF